MAQYDVTGPDGTQYTVTGPDGASNEEVLRQIDAYNKQSSAQPSAPAPAANVPSAPADQPVAPLRSPTMMGELSGGLKQIGESVLPSKPAPFSLNPVDEANALLQTPAAKLGLGAIRAAAFPYAPIDRTAAKVGAGTQDWLLSQGVNPTLAAALATAADMTVGIGGTAGVGAIPALLKRVAPGLTSKIGSMLATRGEKVAAQEAAANAATKSADEALAAQQANVAARNESVQSIADAAKTTVPGRTDVQNIAGNQLGNAAGQDVINTYQAGLDASKKKFEQLYEGKLGQAGAKEAAPTNYEGAMQNILDRMGVTKPQPTSAERVAAKGKSMLQAESDLADTTAALEDQLKNGTPDQQIMARNALQELPQSQLPNNPTVRDLLFEQKRLRYQERRAYAAGNDNLGRQYKELQGAIGNDIEREAPGIASDIKSIDTQYATEHVPYYSAKAFPRAIANQSPENIATSVIRPNSDANALEKVTRTYDLLSPDQQRSVAMAHLNTGIDKASQAGDFGQGLVKWWDSYRNPSGNANAVLRKAYGKDYQQVDALVNQFRTAKSRDLSGVAQDVFNQGKTELQKAGVAADAQKKVIADNLKEQVTNIVGEKMDPKRIKNYGMFLMVEGGVSSAIGSPTGVLRGVAGGAMVMFPNTMAKLVNLPGGLQLVRRGLRALPGSTEAASTARQIQTLLNSAGLSDTASANQRR